MRTILTVCLIATVMTSCSRKPSAGVEVSNLNPGANEVLRVENTSEGGDISYVRMSGEGMMNRVTRIGNDVIISEPRFDFKYERPGTYTIEVVAENSSVFGGAYTSRRTLTLTVSGGEVTIPKDPPAVVKEQQRINDQEK